MADIDSVLNPYLKRPLVRRRRWTTLRTPTDAGGLGVRRQKHQAATYLFDIRAIFPTKAAADAFWSFMNGKKGALTSFTWTCPRDNTVYTCLGPDDLEEPWEGMEVYEYNFTLEAVA